MMKIFRRAWRRVLAGQRKEEDKRAFSFLKDCPKVLDVGCGQGRLLIFSPERIMGVDGNPATVENCKKQGYNVSCADVRQLPFEDGFFSGVHCSHVIEHFLPVDAHKVLSECDRVLTPGGILVLRSPLLWDEFYSDFTHIRPYNPKSVLRYFLASKSGRLGQRTMDQISAAYSVVALQWRYAPFTSKNIYIHEVFDGLNKWGFPWLKKNGYLLVLKKEGA